MNSVNTTYLINSNDSYYKEFDGTMRPHIMDINKFDREKDITELNSNDLGTDDIIEIDEEYSDLFLEKEYSDLFFERAYIFL